MRDVGHHHAGCAELARANSGGSSRRGCRRLTIVAGGEREDGQERCTRDGKAHKENLLSCALNGGAATTDKTRIRTVRTLLAGRQGSLGKTNIWPGPPFRNRSTKAFAEHGLPPGI